jgi:hypothetical protein
MVGIQSAVLQERNDVDVVEFPDFVNYTDFVQKRGIFGFVCSGFEDFPGECLSSLISPALGLQTSAFLFVSIYRQGQR